MDNRQFSLSFERFRAAHSASTNVRDSILPAPSQATHASPAIVTGPVLDTVAPSTITLSAMASQGNCPFLDKIPGELRNAIYQLVLASDDEGEIELALARPPTSALRLCCREIHAEVEGLYKDACKRYWEQNDFRITVDDAVKPGTSPLLSRIRHALATGQDPDLTRKHLDHIRSITLIFHRRSGELCKRSYIHTSDIWHQKLTDRDGRVISTQDTYLWYLARACAIDTSVDRSWAYFDWHDALGKLEMQVMAGRRRCTAPLHVQLWSLLDFLGLPR